MSENPHITKEGVEVKPGQKWRDLDKRMLGRVVTVIEVKDGKATVSSHPHIRSMRSTISVRRMHRHSTGFELVAPNTENSGE